MNFEGLTFSNFGEITILRLAGRVSGIGGAVSLLPLSIQPLNDWKAVSERLARARSSRLQRLKRRFRKLRFAEQKEKSRENNAVSVKRAGAFRQSFRDPLQIAPLCVVRPAAGLRCSSRAASPQTELVPVFRLFLLTLSAASHGGPFFFFESGSKTVRPSL